MSWFQRRWVIQEYALSPYANRYLILGDLLIESRRFEDLLWEAPSHLYSGPFETGGIAGLNNIIEAFFAHSSAKCLNLVDRVFALMSLVDESQNVDLTVDYSISVAELNHRVASAALILSNNSEPDEIILISFEQRIHVLLAATCRQSWIFRQAPMSL
jgi:hypothetical protein